MKEREQEEKHEIVHERERNWNSPRPHWSTSKSPSASHLKVQNNNNSLRATSSLTHLGESNGHQVASRMATKPQSASPKVDSSSTTSSALLHKAGDPSNSGMDESVVGTTHSPQLKGLSPAKSPGAASKFGWNFSRSPLPPLELDDRAGRRKSTSSPTPGSRPSRGTSEANMSSQIPMRSRMKSFSSVGHATTDMSLTHVVGEESSFQGDHQKGMSDAVGPHSHGEPPAAGNSWSQEDMILGVSLSAFILWISHNNIPGSDEESIVDLPPQSTTPKSNPPAPVPDEIETDAETEVLTSPSPQGSPQLGAPATILDNSSCSQTPKPSPEEPSVSATPPGTPPATSPGSQLPTSEMSPSFSLVTPPRQTSFSSSILDFRTPSPPLDLPDLPGPPSSSDDDALGNTPIKDRRAAPNANFTLTKTPRPPGAWAATPLPPKFDHRSSSPAAIFPLESTPPAFTSTPLPRANSYPHTVPDAETDDDPGEDGLLTPVATLSRAKSLPLRTPAPPGAWLATPGQSALLNNGVDQSQYGSLNKRKGLLKVRFDVAESEASATEGFPNSPLSAIRLANPELPSPKPTTGHGTDNNVETVATKVPQSASISPVQHRPDTLEQPATPISLDNGPSPRSLRKSPSVRLVDAYGRERVNEEGTAKSFIDLPNGHAGAERKSTTSPFTPRRSLVRIVDAMGRDMDDVVEVPDASEGRANRLFEADVSDDIPIGHAEALVRMRRTLRELAESLNDTDRWVVFYACQEAGNEPLDRWLGPKISNSILVILSSWRKSPRQLGSPGTSSPIISI